MDGLKIEIEVRPCWLLRYNQQVKAIFHCFTNEGHAVVELEDGSCTTTDAWNIKFITSKVSEYNYKTDKE